MLFQFFDVFKPSAAPRASRLARVEERLGLGGVPATTCVPPRRTRRTPRPRRADRGVGRNSPRIRRRLRTPPFRSAASGPWARAVEATAARPRRSRRPPARRTRAGPSAASRTRSRLGKSAPRIGANGARMTTRGTVVRRDSSGRPPPALPLPPPPRAAAPPPRERKTLRASGALSGRRGRRRTSDRSRSTSVPGRMCAWVSIETGSRRRRGDDVDIPRRPGRPDFGAAADSSTRLGVRL